MTVKAIHTTRPFMSGRSQAIRIPRDFRMEDTELVINQIGDSLVITPKASLREAFFSGIAMLPDDFLADVRAKGDELRRLLTGAPGILSVSGMGLMLGLETVRPAPEVVSACMENGVLCLTAKDKVRLLPALNIPRDLLQKAAEVILIAARPSAASACPVQTKG